MKWKSHFGIVGDYSVILLLKVLSAIKVVSTSSFCYEPPWPVCSGGGRHLVAAGVFFICGDF